jgi:N-methylhydantoinase B
MPIFVRGHVAAFMAAAAHISDIGGRLDEFDARDVYEEGLRIPPSKLFEEGRRNEQLFSILEANIRYPRMVMGDVEAIVGAFRVGAQRYQELDGDYRPGDLDKVAEEILGRSETAMRQAIQRVPNGHYHHTVQADGYKQPTTIQAQIVVEEDSIRIDYSGSSDQRDDASINCVMNNTFAHTVYPLKCSLVPDLPNNEGLFRPISAVAPEGSILNARFPAPVKARSKTSYHVHNAIYGALAPVLPKAVQAGSGSFWSIKCFGRDESGTPFAVHVLPNGGKGAVEGLDGLPTIAFPANGTITPAEIIEIGSPLLVLERSLRRDSGGAGRNRGGLGQTIRLGCARGARLSLTIRPDKIRFPAPGLAGGLPGSPGELTLDDQPLALEPFELTPGQVVTMKLPGGGGLGDPLEREPDALRRDIEQGFVSIEAARDLYGFEQPANE